METKVCRKCGEVKPIAEFGLDAQKYDGRCWWCKDCMRKAHQRRKAIRMGGGNVILAKFPTEILLKELLFRNSGY